VPGTCGKCTDEGEGKGEAATSEMMPACKASKVREFMSRIAFLVT